MPGAWIVVSAARTPVETGSGAIGDPALNFQAEFAKQYELVLGGGSAAIPARQEARRFAHHGSQFRIWAAQNLYKQYLYEVYSHSTDLVRFWEDKPASGVAQLYMALNPIETVSERLNLFLMPYSVTCVVALDGDTGDVKSRDVELLSYANIIAHKDPQYDKPEDDLSSVAHPRNLKPLDKQLDKAYLESALPYVYKGKAVGYTYIPFHLDWQTAGSTVDAHWLDVYVDHKHDNRLLIFDNSGAGWYPSIPSLEENLERAIAYALGTTLHGIAEVKPWQGPVQDVPFQGIAFEYWRKNMWRTKREEQWQNPTSCHWAALRFLSSMMTNTPFATGNTKHGTKFGWNSFAEMEVAGAMAVQLRGLGAGAFITEADVIAVNKMVIDANPPQVVVGARRSLSMGSQLRLMY